MVNLQGEVQEIAHVYQAYLTVTKRSRIYHFFEGKINVSIGIKKV